MKLLRNYIIVLGAVALVTVGLAFLSVRGYLMKPTVVVVSHSDPFLCSELGEKYDDLILLLTHAKKNATKIEQRPDQPHGYPAYTLQTKTDANRRIGAYDLWIISMINRTAVLKDLLTGECYQISVADFETLLSHEAFFEDLTQPLYCGQLLTVGHCSDILGNSSTLYSYNIKGSFVPVPPGTMEVPPTPISMSVEGALAKPQIKATIPTDAWSLTVQKDGVKVITQDRVSASDLYFPTEPGTYTYQLTAHWDLSAQRDWYGDITYDLEIHITEPKAE